MALDIGAALRRGYGRTFKRNGLLLMAVFFVFKLVNAVVGQSFSVAMRRTMQEMRRQMSGTMPGEMASGPTPFAIEMPLALALVLLLVVALLAEAIFIVAVRTMVSDETEMVPREFVRRRILGATANGFVGGVIVTLLTTIGLVLFIVPGVFIALSFFFVRQEVAVADKNFLEAMRGSWSLTSGNRLELLALAIVILIAGVLAAVITAPFTLLGPAVTAVVANAIDAVFTVFGVAVASRAYDQLRSESTAAPTSESPGALGPDELEEYGTSDETDPAGP